MSAFDLTVSETAKYKNWLRVYTIHKPSKGFNTSIAICWSICDILFLIFLWHYFRFWYKKRQGKRYKKYRRGSCKVEVRVVWRHSLSSPFALPLLVVRWWCKDLYVSFKEEISWKMKPVIRLQVSCWSVLYTSNRKRSMFMEERHTKQDRARSHMSGRCWESKKDFVGG